MDLHFAKVSPMSILIFLIGGAFKDDTRNASLDFPRSSQWEGTKLKEHKHDYGSDANMHWLHRHHGHFMVNP